LKSLALMLVCALNNLNYEGQFNSYMTYSLKIVDNSAYGLEYENKFISGLHLAC
jgi:hypothetical protein